MSESSPNVKVAYGPYGLDEGNSIFVEVENVDRFPVKSLRVYVQQLVPDIENFASAHIGSHREFLTGETGELAPGELRIFVLASQSITALRSFVESLPPENVSVGIELNGANERILNGHKLYELVHTAFPDDA